jgi:hypothetical protein
MFDDGPFATSFVIEGSFVTVKLPKIFWKATAKSRPWFTVDPDNHRQRTRGGVVGSVDIQEETILARTLGRLGDYGTRCVRVLGTDRTITSGADNRTAVDGGSLRSLLSE